MPNSNRKLVNYLPAIYHDSKDLGVLLSVFEKILYGVDGQDQRKKNPRQSLDKPLSVLDGIVTISCLYDAHETPQDFLPWLAEWVALSHREGLTEQQQRNLLAEIVPLYAKRGTKAYLERLLQFFKPQNTTVVVDDQPLQGFTIGNAKLGINTRLEPERPFWFKVTVTGPDVKSNAQPARRKRVEDCIRRVVDLAKPAFTLYELHWGKVEEG